MTSAAIRWVVAACIPAALSCGGPSAATPSDPAKRTAAPAKVAPPKVAPKPGTVTRIPLEAFFPLQQAQAALIFDVRPGFFFSLGHIPGAVNWPKSQFASRLVVHEAEIRAAGAAKRPVILYCTDLACPDSDKIASRLAALGYSVRILDGGYAAWKAADLPSE